MNLEKNIGKSLSEYHSITALIHPIEKTINIQSIIIYPIDSKSIQDGLNFNDLIHCGIDETLLYDVLKFITNYFKGYTFWWYDYHEVLPDNFIELSNFYKIYKYFKSNKLIDKFFFVDNNIKKSNKKIPYYGLPGMIGTTFNSKQNKNEDRIFEKQFICLNRVDKKHRRDVYDFLNKKNLIKKTFLSYTSNEPLNKRHHLLENNSITETGKRQFVSKYQYKSFCNIVTESQYNSRMIHITEKIDKCFSSLQPFILVAGPYYIKSLHELGFKTFSDWWDESYDLEENYEKRIIKINNIIEEVSNFSLQDCQQIYKEMNYVLNHNYELCKKISYDTKIHLEYWKSIYIKL